PTISPIYDSRSLGDFLIEASVGQVAVKGLLGKIASQPNASHYAYIRDHWKETVYGKTTQNAATFEAFWEDSIRTGFVKLSSTKSASARRFNSGSFSLFPAA